MGMKDFFKTMGMSLNPGAYDKLSERKLTHSKLYYISMVAAVFIVMCIMLIPMLVMLPGNMETALGNFQSLDIKINGTTKGPIYIPGEKPVITIDTSQEYRSVDEGNVVIARGAVLYKLLPFTKPKMIVREGDFLENKGQLAAVFMIMLIGMLPMLLVAAYLYFLIKYFLVILAAVIISFMVVRIMRFGITMGELFKVGLYASTIMVIAGLLTKPFVPFIYYIDILLFIVYMVLGIVKVGSFESVVRPKKHKASAYERQNK